MNNWQDFEPAPVNQEADASNLGGLFGEWYDWGDPGLGDTSSFYTPAGGTGDSSYDARVDEKGLRNWFGTTGNRLKYYYVGNTQNFNVFNPNGDMLGRTLSVNNDDSHNRLFFTLGSMAIGGAGGALAGGAGIGGDAAASLAGSNATNAALAESAIGTAGYGASSASANTALASGINGGLSGLTNTMPGKDSLRSAAVGTLSGGYSPDVAGYMGIENPLLASSVNGATRGAASAGLSGGDAREGFVRGGLPGLASYAADSVAPYFSNTTTDGGGGNNVTYEEGGYSRAPWAQTKDNSIFVDGAGPQSLPTNYNPSTEGTSVFTDGTKRASSSNSGFESPALTQFFDKLIPSSPSGWGDMAQGLMGMYGGYRQRRDARKMRDQYGPNRATYGQQLQQTLQRRDAASGRRSDYGGRAVELQAKLADLDSRNAPMMSQLSNQSTMGLANMLQSGLRYGGKAGWFGDKYNPNVPTAPATSAMLPSTWTQPQPTNMDLNYDPALGRNRYKLGGG